MTKATKWMVVISIIFGGFALGMLFQAQTQQGPVSGDSVFPNSDAAGVNAVVVEDDVLVKGLFAVQSPATDAINMIVSDDGVGIGTTSPRGPLGIRATGPSEELLSFEDPSGSTMWHINQNLGGIRPGLNFAETDVADGRLFLEAGGNVGIGTTSPGHKLEVASSGPSTVDFRVGSANAWLEMFIGGNSRLSLGDGSDAKEAGFIAGGENASNENTLTIAGCDNAGNCPTFTTFHQSGNVGIGVDNPGNILTVKQFTATDPIADAWTIYSSKRWKTNINTIGDALETVQRLRGVSYDWKTDGKQDIGLIAEEVGEVIPEIVQYEENGVDARSLDYARLIPILIEAIKEQQQKIEALENKITEIEGSNTK